MSWTNIFYKHFPDYWGDTEIYLHMSQRGFLCFFLEIDILLSLPQLLYNS